MNFHIWKPESNRWIVIRTENGQLFDVRRAGKKFTIGPSIETDYKTVVNAVRLFEYGTHTAGNYETDVGESVLDFAGY